MFFNLLAGDEVAHLVEHAPDLGSILVHPGVPDALEPEGAHRPLVLLLGAYDAPHLRNLEGAHSAIFTPLLFSISALVLSCLRPCTVACTRFTAVVEPSALVSTSLTPASSITALTAPPAMTPVPSEAGLSITEELSNLPRTSCGIVVLRIGTSNMLALARSWPLPIAAGTVFALPRPTPTLPFPSPTTTRALKLNRRPPLTTLATRRISTTLSWNSLPSRWPRSRGRGPRASRSRVVPPPPRGFPLVAPEGPCPLLCPVLGRPKVSSS